MKKITVALVLFVTLLAGQAVFSVRAQSGQFIIEGADGVSTLSFTTSSDLVALITQTAPRIVFQHARSNRHITLAPVPAALSNLLAGIHPRLVVQHAHANRHLALIPPSAQLNTLLNQLLPRLVLQHARANRVLEMGYPRALIGDTTPPQVTQIAVNMMGEDSAIVTWTTDEFADSTVKCGTQSGNYTMTFSDPLYVKQHTLTLTGLAAGTTFYCVCRSADLSGNTYQSQEFHFEQTEEIFVYLPLVLRSR